MARVVHDAPSLTILPAAPKLCQWPGCDRRAVTALALCTYPMYFVCAGHRAEWFTRTFGELARLDWQPVRRSR